MFVRILNTSMISCYIIVVVMLFRTLLLRAERKYVYWLWFVVFVNLCIPFRISGPFSLIPRWVANFDIAEWGNAVVLPAQSIVEEVTSGSVHHGYVSTDGKGAVPGTDLNRESTYIQEEAKAYSEYIPNVKITENNTENAHEYIPERLDGGVPGIDSNTGTTYHAYHMENMFDRNLQKILAVVWGFGVCVLAVGAVRSSVKLQRRLRDAVLVEGTEKIKTTDKIETPFLWGIFEPVIYLPHRIDESERKYIIAHESFHRKRRDYIVKPLFFIIAVIHWFNPFVWAAYFLFVRDMEISCDEAVIAAADKDIRKEYAASILKYAARLNGYTLTPITFGEPSLKSRIKNVLHFRERSPVLSVMMLPIVVLLMTGLTAKPSLEEQREWNLDSMVHWESMPEGTGTEILVPAESMMEFREAVIALIDELAAYIKNR